ncbi:MAG: type I pullulanase [Fusicatenibacter sp.]|nr:type I pullulanase [Fusicatenibacter sp.]
MKIVLNRLDWQNFRRGEEKCFLLTNGLGGFSSLTVMGNTARGDQALFMAAVKAPNVRYHLLTNLWEELEMDGETVKLYSQEFVNRTKNVEGFRYLEGFEMELLPVWFYRVRGIEIEKTVGMVQGENTVIVRYVVRGDGKKGRILHVTPLLKFAPKGKDTSGNLAFSVDERCIAGGGIMLYYKSNGITRKTESEFLPDLYFEQDARDGREAVGGAVRNHCLDFELADDTKEQIFYVVYSLQGNVEKWDEQTISGWMEQERKRREGLIAQSKITDPAGQVLAASAQQYIVERESTGGKSILAGFPYFEDWGRDTMIALPGCTLATGDYESCRSILRTFMTYCRNGLMPNLFPEGDAQPMYNTVDAALLFLNVVYLYYLETGDLSFVREAYPVMEEIVFWYRKGTDFHIRMDEDGLIMAGDGLEQVTWMDVRIGEELPTPRHGKPVEINAYWYNGLKIMEELSPYAGKDGTEYAALAERVKKSFLENFWMEDKGWLRDVRNGTAEEEQFRCNQIFALALPYTIPSKEQGRRILAAVKENLYTTAGLRSLSPLDPAFHPFYGGSQPERDRAYHQGTVWGFPLGAYYRAVLKYAESEEEGKREVRRGLDRLESWLYEGCLFHLAEIYDGENPVASRGCYAQAWSVGELLTVYKEMENKKTNPKVKRTPKEWKEYFESEEFQNQYCYDGEDLGASVGKTQNGDMETVWKLWAPTAMEVSLELYTRGSADETGDQKIGSYPMHEEEKGVWTYRTKGNLSGTYYTYHVVHSEGIFDVIDPWGKASGIDSQRSMVICLSDTDPKGWQEDVRPVIRKEDRCIYELHVKDFSDDPHSGIRPEYRGKFLAFTEKGTTLDGKGSFSTGLDYLKSLGISHVHLLPAFDYGSVKESDPNAFNWGYDPVQYNVPEGSYSTDPYHGEVRIREMKEMVKALHDAGIGVIMDVVYNHTFSLDSSFEKTVPYYFYRQWPDGSFSNGSDCGNETASEREMFRRFMVQSVCYWAKEYHIDGFRFDLMALHDTETMNAIRRALNQLPGGREILMYGEPWKASASAMQEGYFPADKQNLFRLEEGIAMFCDDTRDAVKGSVFIAGEGGYVNGKERLSSGILSATDAWMDGKGVFHPDSPEQLIAYVSAHDNFTLWDKLKMSDPLRKNEEGEAGNSPDFEQPDEHTLSMNRLAAGIILTCKGIPFFQAGEEFGRTKLGDDNSYCSGREINRLDWTRACEMQSLTDYYRGLLKLRSRYDAFGTYESGCEKTFYRKDHAAGYFLQYPDGRGAAVLYNPWEEARTCELPEGSWEILCDGTICCDHGETVMENAVVKAKSMMILAKKQ